MVIEEVIEEVENKQNLKFRNNINKYSARRASRACADDVNT